MTPLYPDIQLPSIASIGRSIFDMASQALFGSAIEEEIHYPSAMFDSDRYKPSVSDILTVKEALHKKSTLPYELVDTIVDMAEYWPHTTTYLQEQTRVTAGKERENSFILRSYPLGYVQPAPNLTIEKYQIHYQYSRTYQSKQPKPWAETCNVPDEATNETLSNWTTKSLPKGENPCRKIVFTIKSRDQGWGGNPTHKGTYEGSFTWFDVGLERMTATREGILLDKSEMAPSPQFELNRSNLENVRLPLEQTASDALLCSLRTINPMTSKKLYEEAHDTFQHDLLPSTMALQKNRTATRETTEYKITWSYDDNVVTDSLEAAELEKQGRGRETGSGEFVRNMRIGDVVTVWAKARFPQWINFVEEVKIEVYWAV